MENDELETKIEVLCLENKALRGRVTTLEDAFLISAEQWASSEEATACG